MSISRLLLDNGADVSLLSCEMELPVDVSQSETVTDLLNETMRARGIDPAVARQSEEHLLLRDVKQMLDTGKYDLLTKFCRIIVLVYTPGPVYALPGRAKSWDTEDPDCVRFLFQITC
ncbi:unnamed protein product [Echinostoma caproni]|uniref:Peptidase A2 domain-containing protein n=1 Tax=Echinostoma caproni TaxID=27848 RepID=A0A183ABI8_9TREM|nr:unnamed protein product [Echinostoma caproni]